MENKLIDNRYRLKRRIGEGGMASVYLAFDEKLHRNIAIKILHPHLCRDEEIRQRFNLEARALSGTEHPNIINIYDFSGLKSEQLWIVTEILKGVNLGQYADKFEGHRLHPIIATFIVIEVLKALEHAHQKGIIHRDIKPENIMVLNIGQIKLMDFGISKNIHTNEMTRPGSFMGSPSYMSPEQIRGNEIDHRSDIYSLCVLFYEIITGILPFSGNTTPEVINKIIMGKFIPPQMILNTIPDELNNLIVKGMSINPESRYAHIRSLILLLNRFISNYRFEESHVELERFFKDPTRFIERLAEIPSKRENLVEQTPVPPVFKSNQAPTMHINNEKNQRKNSPLSFAVNEQLLNSTKTKMAPAVEVITQQVQVNAGGMTQPQIFDQNRPLPQQKERMVRIRGFTPGQMMRGKNAKIRSIFTAIQRKETFIEALFGLVIVGGMIFVLVAITTIIILSLQSNQLKVTETRTTETSSVIPDSNLIIKSNRAPIKVIMIGIDQKTKNSVFNFSEKVSKLNILPGKYSIRAEFEGSVIEKLIKISPENPVTFNVTFRDEREIKN